MDQLNGKQCGCDQRKPSRYNTAKTRDKDTAGGVQTRSKGAPLNLQRKRVHPDTKAKRANTKVAVNTKVLNSKIRVESGSDSDDDDDDDEYEEDSFLSTEDDVLSSSQSSSSTPSEGEEGEEEPYSEYDDKSIESSGSPRPALSDQTKAGAILRMFSFAQGLAAAEENDNTDFDEKYKSMVSEKLTGSQLEDAVQVFVRGSSRISTKPGVVGPTSPNVKEDRCDLTGEPNPTAVEIDVAAFDESASPVHSLNGYTKLRQILADQLTEYPDNPIVPDMIRQTDSKIAAIISDTRTNNTRAYFNLVAADNKKEKEDEVAYFFKNCSATEQANYLVKLTQVNAHVAVDKPYRLLVLESDLSVPNKAVILGKLRALNALTPQDTEYTKLRHWIDGIMRVPFGVYRPLTVQMGVSTPTECRLFLENARRQLDVCTYGMKDAKAQIMQMLGSWVANPESRGHAIAIEGPMGTGKTTLIKEGVSKILGRDFAFIALGGATGGAYLDGFNYTYDGSTWGKIVQIVMDAKSMNPVIYFDELDKISGTPQGMEIENILVHLTDSSQNSEFCDKYFSELSFPLDKCMFIFSYNDRTKINPILLDRMYNIKTKGYGAKEKMVIAQQYLVPAIAEQLKFAPGDVVIPDEILAEMVEKYTGSGGGTQVPEQGVRNLKRCLETVFAKLNLLRLGCEADMELGSTKLDLTVLAFPLTLDSAMLKVLVGGDTQVTPSWMAMYN